jgi:hypothetical protein
VIRVEGLGRLDSPMGVLKIGGDTRLVIMPWAALGTDFLLAGTSTALFLSTKSTALKVLSVLTAGWSIIAIGVEVTKLIYFSKADAEDIIAREP